MREWSTPGSEASARRLQYTGSIQYPVPTVSRQCQDCWTPTVFRETWSQNQISWQLTAEGTTARGQSVRRIRIRGSLSSVLL